MTTHTELEMRWINAWNDLYDILAQRSPEMCQLPDGSVVDIEACKGWLQDSVYEGFLVKVESGWVQGKPGVIVHKYPPA